MSTIVSQYENVRELDVSESPARQPQFKRSVSHVGWLWSLIVLLAVSTGFFGWLALRNARTLECDDINFNPMYHTTTCEIFMENQ